MVMNITDNDVLVIVDPQNDFCPGGALAVAGGDDIMAPIAKIAELFTNIVVTQDYHPKGHSSFASQHEGKNPFDMIEMPYGAQVLWPDHCVQGTKGADFHPDILSTVARATLIIRKGMNPEVDSYSAFMENDKVTKTGLGGYLRTRNLRRAFFVGLARDYCVGFSAIDGNKEGLDSYIVEDLTTFISEGSSDDMTNDFVEVGVISINSGEISSA